MANQNFRVKKGLEVGVGGTILYVDTDGLGVNQPNPSGRQVEVNLHTELQQTLRVTGVSTFVGISTFESDVYIGRDLYVERQLIFADFEAETGRVTGILTVADFNATGISTIEDARITDLTAGVSTFTGITTFLDTVFTDDISVGGAITASTGNFQFTNLQGENLLFTGVGTFTGSIEINDLQVSGVSTVAFTTITEAYINDATIETLQLENVDVGVATIGFATITDAYIGVATVNDIYVENLLYDANSNVGAADSILATAGGKLVWTRPDLVGVATAFVPGSTFYVSENGSDSNLGNSVEKPWKTLAYALTQVSAGDNQAILMTAGNYEEAFPLVVPDGVTIVGAGQRATYIFPNLASRGANGFTLGNGSGVEDLTIGGMVKDGAENYAFSFTSGTTISSRSPYIQRVTVLNKGSATTATDPYGYNSSDSPPSSFVAAGGVIVDGAEVDASSIEAGFLLNEVTIFAPKANGVLLTNGARCEQVNCFIYFAEAAVIGITDRTTGFGGAGRTRLAVDNPTAAPAPGNTIQYFDSDGTTLLANGTIDAFDGTYIYLTDSGTGEFSVPRNRVPKAVNFTDTAVLTTAVKRFGTASLDVTGGNTDAITIDANGDFGFGTGDFTVEFWVNRTTNINNTVLFDLRETQTDTALSIHGNGGDAVNVYIGNTTVIAGTTALTLNGWNHIAVTRESGTLRLFVDGVANGTVANTDDLGSSKPVHFGDDFDDANSPSVYLDELRITKGVSKYNGAFTAPSAQLKGDANTSILLHFDGLNGATATTDDVIVYQDIRFNGNSADKITLADYTQFGCDLRTVGSAAEYGNRGIVGTGPGAVMRLISINFNHVGARGSISNDYREATKANEVQNVDGLAKIAYVSIDELGDFRVGDAFYVNQETGEVSFQSVTNDLTSLASLTVTDGVNNSIITPTSGRFGNVLISGNDVESVSGDLNLLAAGGADINIIGDTNVIGILTAQVIEINAIQRGDTSIALDDTGTDGTIRFNTENTEAMRIDNQQNVGIKTAAIRADLDVVGDTLLEFLEVTETATINTLGVTTDAKINQNLEVVGVTTLTEYLNVVGPSTFVGVVTTSDDLFVGANLSVGGSLQFTDISGENLEVTGIATIQYADITDELVGVSTVGYSNITEATVGVATITFANITDETVGVSSVGLASITKSETTVAEIYEEVVGFSTIGYADITDALVGTSTITTADITDATVDFADIIDAQIGVASVGLASITKSETTVAEIYEEVVGFSTVGFATITDGYIGVATVGVLTVSETSTFVGVVTTSDDLFVGGDLGVAGNLKLEGNIELDDIVARNIDISGIATINTLGVTTDANIGQNLEVVGVTTLTGIVTTGTDVFVGNNLSVAANTDILGDLTVEGNLNVTGDISYDEVSGRNINISGVGTIAQLGVSTFTATDAVIGVATITDADIDFADIVDEVVGTSTVTYALIQDEVVGTSTITTADVTDATVDYADITDANVGVATIAYSNTTDAVVGFTTITGAEIGVATVTGNFTVSGVTTLTGIVTTGTDVFVGNNLSVAGNLALAGDIQLEDIFATNLNVSGTGRINTGIITDLTAEVATIQDETVGTSTITYALIEDELVGVSTVGYSDIADARIGFATVTSDLTVDRNAVVTGLSTFNSDARFTQDVFVEGDLNVTGDIVYDEITGRNLSISGIATIADLEVENDLDVGQNLDVVGIATVGVLSTANALIGIASVGILTAKDGFFETLTFGSGGGGGGGGGGTGINSESVTTGNLVVTGIASITTGIVTNLTVEVANITDETVGTSTITTADITDATIDFADITDANIGVATVGLQTVTTNLFVGDKLSVVGTSSFFSDVYVDGNINVTGSQNVESFGAVNLEVTGIATISDADITDARVGVATIGIASVTTLEVTNAGVYDATVAILTAEDSTLGAATVTYADITDALVGVETVGYSDITDASIGFSTITGAEIGVATVTGDLTVEGNLNVTGDISYDEVSGRNLNISGVGTIQQLGVSTFTATDAAIGVATIGYADVTDAAIGVLTVTTASVTGDLTVEGNFDLTGDVTVDELTARNLDVTGVGTIAQLGVSTFAATDSTLGVATITTADITDATVDFADIVDARAGVLTVTGISSFQSDISVVADVTIDGNLNISGSQNVQSFGAVDLEITGIATIATSDVTDAAIGVATIGYSDITDLNVGVATVALLEVSSANIGVATVTGDFTVEGNLNVTGDISYDEVSGRNLNISGVGTISQLGVSTFTATDAAVGVATIGYADVTDLAAGVATVASANIGVATITGDLTVEGNVNVTGDISYDEVSGRNLNITGVGTISQLGVSTFTATDSTLGVATITAADIDATTIEFANITEETVGISTIGYADITDAAIGVATITAADIDASTIDFATITDANIGVASVGLASVTELEVSTVVGYSATFTDFQVTGAVSLPGIPIQGGDAEFRNLNITGVSSFTGITTFNNNVFVDGNLTVSGIRIEETVAGENLLVTGVATIVAGVFTSVYVSGLTTLTDAAIGVATIGYADISDANVGVLTVGTAQITGDLTVDGNVNVTGDISYDEVSGRNLNITGVGTIAQLGVTTFSVEDAAIGVATIGYADVTDLAAGVSTIGFAKVTDLNAGVATLTSANIGVATITGDLTVDGNVNVTGDISYDEVSGRNLNISGVGTIAQLGVSTFTATDAVIGVATITTVDITTLGVGDVTIDVLDVTDANIGVATIGFSTTTEAFIGLATITDANIGVVTAGTATITGDLTVEGNVNVTGDISYDEVTGKNINISGVGTIAQLGVSTFTATDSTLGVATITTAVIASADIADATIEYADMVDAKAGVATVGYLTATDAFIGFGTFGSAKVIGDLTVDGDFALTGDVVLDEIEARGLVVTGIATINDLEINILSGGNAGFDSVISTFVSADSLNAGVATITTADVGFVTATNLFVSGVVTSTNGFEGNLTGNTGGTHTGNQEGDVYSRDGSQLVLEVPASTGTAVYTGIVTGNVTGDLTGNSFGTHTGQQNGDVYTADGATLVVDTANTPSPIFKGDAEGLTGTPDIEVRDIEARDITSSGVTTLTSAIIGVATVTGDLTIEGNVNVTGDISYDEVTGKNINISGVGTISQLGVSTFTADDAVIGVATITTADITTATIDFATITDEAVGTSTVAYADITDATVGVITATSGFFTNLTFGGTGSGIDENSVTTENLNVTGIGTIAYADLPELASGIATITDANIGVATVGLASITTAGVGTLTAYEGEFQRLTVPEGGFVSLPGIPVSGGSATFAELSVTGVSTFGGIATFTNDVYVDGDLFVTGDQVFEGASAVNLTVSGVLTATNITSTGIVTFADARIDDATIGFADVTDLAAGVATLTSANIGVATITGDLTILGNVNVTGDISYDEVTGKNISISGVGTIAQLGVSTFTADDAAIGVATIGYANVTDLVAGVATITTGTVTDLDSDLITTIGASVGVATVGFLTATDAFIGVATVQDLNSLSDRRVKENVRVVEDPLTKIEQINGVHFDFVNSGKKSMGVIAQEVEEVFPELIAGTFPKSVNYNGLIGVLIESVKELKKQNDTLSARIDELENK